MGRRTCVPVSPRGNYTSAIASKTMPSSERSVTSTGPGRGCPRRVSKRRQNGPRWNGTTTVRRPTSSGGERADFRYDIDREAPDGGFPRTIRDTWPGADCRLGRGVRRPDRPVFGRQARRETGRATLSAGHAPGPGWLGHGSSVHEPERLGREDRWRDAPKHIGGEPLQPGQISRLAINAHGSEHGEVALNGRSNANVLDVNTVDDPANRNKLEQIGRMVAQPGIILLWDAGRLASTRAS